MIGETHRKRGPHRASRIQRIAVIQQPMVIAAILDCLRQKGQPP